VPKITGIHIPTTPAQKSPIASFLIVIFSSSSSTVCKCTFVLANIKVPAEKSRNTPLQNEIRSSSRKRDDNAKYVRMVDRGEDKAKRRSCRLTEWRGYDSRSRIAVRENDAGA
jgi:hypothetical protein